MDYTAILKYAFANLNGATESAILFILVIFDTFLGSKWRKVNKVAITSGGGLEGLKTNIPLALMPISIWAFTILISVVPTHIGGRDFVFNTMIFDIISFVITLTIGNFMLKSIFANAQLAGFDFPNWIIKWVEDEYHVKFQKMINEPAAANVEKVSEEK